MKYLTEVEAARVVEGALSNRDKAMARVLLGTGMRLGELCGLRWKDLDPEAKTISIERIVIPLGTGTVKFTGKNAMGYSWYKATRQLTFLFPDGSVRQILPKDLPQILAKEFPDTREIVRVGTKAKGRYGRVIALVDPMGETWTRLAAERQGRKPDDWCWLSSWKTKSKIWDGRMTYGTVTDAIYRWIQRAEIPKEKAHPHALRHTFAVLSLKKGASLRWVQRQLGHSNISMTARYLDLIATDLVELGSKLDLGF